MDFAVFLFLIFILMCLVFLITLEVKRLRYNKTSQYLMDFISKSSEILTKYEKEQELENIKRSIDLYSKLQVIQKISDADYISCFKYDYTNKDLNLIFLMTVNKKSNLMSDSVLYKANMNGDFINKLLFESREEFGLVDVNSVQNESVKNLIEIRELNKLFFVNIFKDDDDKPVGVIVLSYKDVNTIIHDDIKIEIERMSKSLIYYM